MFVQAGAFDLVGTIIYEIDGKPYQSTFYNGTIEVVEDGPLFRMESVFLSGLLIFVIVLLAIYIQNGLKHMTKVHPISLSYYTFHSMFHFLLGKTLVLILRMISLNSSRRKQREHRKLKLGPQLKMLCMMNGLRYSSHKT